MTPFLSICIPTYNREAYLRRCLESLSSQRGDFEVVISDNASSDGTSDVVAEFVELPIRYIRQPENVGAVENFVRVIGSAEGRYVCVVTDDDWLVPGAVARLTDWLSRHEPDIAKTDLMFLSDSRSVQYLGLDTEILPDETGDEGARSLLTVFHVWTGLCFRREALDYDFFVSHRPTWYPHLLILGMLRHRPAYLPEPLFVHRSDSELYAEAIAAAGAAAFLPDLGKTFDVLSAEMDPDLMAKMSADAVRRLSLGASHVVDVSPVAEYLDDDWKAQERRLRVVLFVRRFGSPLLRGLRSLYSRLAR